MYHPTYIVLHKNEWDRIMTQGKPPGTTKPRDEREEYINGLIETSQKWIQSWPDSVAGHIAHAVEENEKHHKEDMALIDKYKKRRVEYNRKAIQDAKRAIFNNSCYGKQLWGALLDSKALEEREAQIEFNNKLKQKERDKEIKQLNEETRQWTNEDENEKNNKKQRRAEALKVVQINKEIEKKKTAALLKLKEEEKCMEIDDKLIKEVQDKERKLEQTLKEKERKEFEHYEAERKAIEQQRILENKRDDLLTELYRKEKDRLHCKMERVRKKIFHDTHNSSKCNQVYDIIDKNLKEKQKQYDEFVEKGIKRSEEREKEQDAKSKQVKPKVDENITYNECSFDDGRSWCQCDRSSLFLNSHSERKNKSINKEDVSIQSNLGLLKNKCEFLRHQTTLKDALNERRKEKSPWSGTLAEHSQFAEEAGKVLEECKYKTYARKVIDKYRHQYGLDSTTLPVPNY